MLTTRTGPKRTPAAATPRRARYHPEVAITTVYSETRNARTISKVRITEPQRAPRSPAIADETWEHHCGACDRTDTGLSEGAARDEIENHVCEVPVG